MTDQELYALKETARKAAQDFYMEGPQWLYGGNSARVEAFAEGAAWQAQRTEAKDREAVSK